MRAPHTQIFKLLGGAILSLFAQQGQNIALTGRNPLSHAKFHPDTDL